MTGSGIPTVLIGFGKVAHGYSCDPAMARYYRYATHAQVLADHPAFDWQMVVDPDESARRTACEHWGIKTAVAALEESVDAARGVEVAVIATMPDQRIEMLDGLPNLRAVLVEKPLGQDLASASRFLDECAKRDIQVQVNLWRRADLGFRTLAHGGLNEAIGSVQSVTGVYGNGLKNNGTHMIDMARMLFGEVKAVQRVGTAVSFQEGPLENDSNPAFALSTEGGITIVFTPLRFARYRENGLSIWGESGRLDILNEGLTVQIHERCRNRAMSGEHEIALDRPVQLPSTVGEALYAMYDNLGDVLNGKAELWSSGASALVTAKVVEAVERAPIDGSVCPV